MATTPEPSSSSSTSFSSISPPSPSLGAAAQEPERTMPTLHELRMKMLQMMEEKTKQRIIEHQKKLLKERETMEEKVLKFSKDLDSLSDEERAKTLEDIEARFREYQREEKERLEKEAKRNAEFLEAVVKVKEESLQKDDPTSKVVLMKRLNQAKLDLLAVLSKSEKDNLISKKDATALRRRCNTDNWILTEEEPNGMKLTKKLQQELVTSGALRTDE